MTSNQIAYRNLQEEIRHNQMSEEQARQALAEQKRAALEAERLKSATLAETIRSNKANEGLKHESNVINRLSISEQTRHNQMTERLSFGQLANDMFKNMSQAKVNAATVEEKKANADYLWSKSLNTSADTANKTIENRYLKDTYKDRVLQQMYQKDMLVEQYIDYRMKSESGYWESAAQANMGKAVQGYSSIMSNFSNMLHGFGGPEKVVNGFKYLLGGTK